MRKFTKYPSNYVKASYDDGNYTEYALEVYSRDDETGYGNFLRQLDVYSTPDDAYTYAEINPLNNPDEVYVITYITYEDGEEVESGMYDTIV